jgi:hypothetical protein
MSAPLKGFPRPPVFDPKGNFTPQWAGWFSTVHQIAQNSSSSGPTTSRPTTNLYVGQPFFDATLGYLVNVKSLNPTVWVNGAGTPS